MDLHRSSDVDLRPSAPFLHCMSSDRVSLAELIADTERLLAITHYGRSSLPSPPSSSSSSGLGQGGPDVAVDAFDGRMSPSVDITIEYSDVDVAITMPPSVRPDLPDRERRTLVPKGGGGPTSAEGPSPSEDIEKSWQHLNDSLIRRGFPSLTFALYPSLLHSTSVDDQLQLITTFERVLEEFVKRGSLIEELVSKGNKESFSAQSLVIDKQKIRIGELSTELARAHSQTDQQREEMREEQKALQAEIQLLKSELERLKEDISSRDRTVSALQKELDVQITATFGTRIDHPSVAQAAQSSFRRLYGRSHDDQNETDQQVMRVILLYETDLAENKHQLSILTTALTEAQNSLQDRHSAAESELTDKQLKMRSMEDEVSQLRSQLRVRNEEFGNVQLRLQQRAQEVEKDHAELRIRYDEIDRQLRHALADLETRPDLQEVATLKANLEKHSKADRDLKDNIVDEVANTRVARLPRSIQTALLEEACQLLDLQEEPTSLNKTLKELTALVRVYPLLLTFANDATAILLPGNAHLLRDHNSREDTIKAALRNLRQWKQDLGLLWSTTTPTSAVETHTPASFHDRLLVELQLRQHKLHTKLDKHSPTDSLWQELSDVVDSENRLYSLMYLAKDDAEREHSNLNLQPKYHHVESASADPAKILAHFQHLFDVPHVNGVLPRMSELHRFASEQHTAMNALRALVKLPSSAPTHTVLKALYARLPLEGSSNGKLDTALLQNSLNNLSLHSHDVMEEKKELIGHDHGVLTDTARVSLVLSELVDMLGVDVSEVIRVVERLLQRNHECEVIERKLQDSDLKQRQYRSILKCLKAHLGVAHTADLAQAVQGLSHPRPSSSDKSLEDIMQMLQVRHVENILPALESILEKMTAYQEIVPSVDDLVSQLFDKLNVNELSDIIPAVQDLKKSIKSPPSFMFPVASIDIDLPKHHSASISLDR